MNNIKKIEYLKKSYEIYLNWKDYAKGKEVSYYCWYNHSISNRAVTFVYFYTLAKDYINIDEKELHELLVKHAEYLNSKYVNNNHGIMMDRSLIILSSFLNHEKSSRWRNKAIFRIKDAFYRDFSYKGIHLENSPEYHNIVRQLYSSTSNILEVNNGSLGDNIKSKLKMTSQYLKYVVKPDGTLPIIGDTELKSLKVNKRFDSMYDEEAGIVIMQTKNENEPNKSTWISFICGYGSQTHKHFDDLSFSLQFNGKDFFIDSGKYNYNENDKIRSISSLHLHIILLQQKINIMNLMIL